MTFGKTFSFAGCNLVLKNASDLVGEKIETEQFFDAMNSTLQILFLTQLVIKKSCFIAKLSISATLLCLSFPKCFT